MRRLVVGAVVLALAAGCYRGGAGAREGAPPSATNSRRVAAANDVLGFLPLASAFVLRVDVARLRDTPAWPRVEARVRARLEPARARCGFDPLATLGSVTVGMRPGDDKPAGVAVARGTDARAVLDCVRDLLRGSPQLTSTPTGVAIREVAPGASLALEMLDAHTLVAEIGPRATLASLAAVLDGGAPLRGSAGFSELYALLPRRSPVWLIANAEAPGLAVAGAALGVVPRAVFGGLELADGLSFEVRVRVDSPDTATSVADRIGAQLSIVRGFFEQIDVSGESTDVVLRAKMTPDQLDTAAGLLGGI